MYDVPCKVLGTDGKLKAHRFFGLFFGCVWEVDGGGIALI